MRHPSEAAWRAARWRANNPDAWRYMERLAAMDAAHGRRISVSRLVEQCRRKDFSAADGEQFKINNNYRAAFARMLIRDHPEWAKYIETRRSWVDGMV